MTSVLDWSTSITLNRTGEWHSPSTAPGPSRSAYRLVWLRNWAGPTRKSLCFSTPRETGSRPRGGRDSRWLGHDLCELWPSRRQSLCGGSNGAPVEDNIPRGPWWLCPVRAGSDWLVTIVLPVCKSSPCPYNGCHGKTRPIWDRKVLSQGTHSPK